MTREKHEPGDGYTATQQALDLAKLPYGKLDRHAYEAAIKAASYLAQIVAEQRGWECTKRG